MTSIPSSLDYLGTLPFYKTGEISLDDYKHFFYEKEKHLFLDVREPWEVRGGCIEGASCIPLGALAAQCAELPKEVWIICYCQHGIRSLHAYRLLKEKGFDKVLSLRGGFHFWRESLL